MGGRCRPSSLGLWWPALRVRDGCSGALLRGLALDGLTSASLWHLPLPLPVSGRVCGSTLSLRSSLRRIDLAVSPPPISTPDLTNRQPRASSFPVVSFRNGQMRTGVFTHACTKETAAVKGAVYAVFPAPHARHTPEGKPRSPNPTRRARFLTVRTRDNTTPPHTLLFMDRGQTPHV